MPAAEQLRALLPPCLALAHAPSPTHCPAYCPALLQFKNSKSGKVFKMSYPCAMLNVSVAENNTNDQFAVRGRVGGWVGGWVAGWESSGRAASEALVSGRTGSSRSSSSSNSSRDAPGTPHSLPHPPALPPLQTLVDKERRQYEVSSEMSIEFEVDGPYKVGGWVGVAFRCAVALLHSAGDAALVLSRRCASAHAPPSVHPLCTL